MVTSYVMRMSGASEATTEQYFSSERYCSVVASLAPDIRITYDVTILDRKSTRLNSSHSQISYALFCLKKTRHAPHPHDSLGHRRAAGTAPPHLPPRAISADARSIHLWPRTSYLLRRPLPGRAGWSVAR